MRVAWDQAPLLSGESGERAALPPLQSLARLALLALLAYFFARLFSPRRSLVPAWSEYERSGINAVDEAKRFMLLSSNKTIME